MNGQAVLETKKPASLTHGDGLLRHATVRSMPDQDTQTAEHVTLPAHDHDFSRLPVSSASTTESLSACPLTPTRCPFGGACHACPVRVQPKLKVGQPDDEYEREADRVADMVMRMPEPTTQSHLTTERQGQFPTRSLNLRTQVTPLAQRQTSPEEEEEEEQTIQTKSQSPGSSTMLQRQAEPADEEDEEIIQAKSTDNGATRAPANVEVNWSLLQGTPQHLTESVRAFFEPRFGYDFKQVRIHSDAGAANLAQSIHAQAFTLGQDIAFGPGQFAPETSTGRRLLAHELTHVMQQERGKTTPRHQVSVQRATEKDASREQSPGPTEQAKPYPPVNWAIDPEKRMALAIPKPGVTLEDVAIFLYGDSAAKDELAAVNKLKPAATLAAGVPLRLTGKKLTQAAFEDVNAAPKVPLGVNDPEAFLAKKQSLDTELERDFKFIVKKLDETHYSDTDEGEVISILQKWGEEKFTSNPKHYPIGGEYLDKLFSMLMRKTKDVGIIATQWTNYYSLIFNHFDRVKEVEAIRDKYSRSFRGDSGRQEESFGGFFWERVKSGKVRDAIFAYFKGLGKGVWSGLKGMFTMAYTLVTDPGKFFSDIAKLPGALKTLWENRSELWKKFTSASPEKQAEMIGEVFGEIEVMIASHGAAKGIAKLAEAPGKLGKVAKVVKVATELPSKALGVAAKGVARAFVQGVGWAVRGAVFAAKGIYRVAGKILCGTWSVIEKVAGKVKSRLYYFYDEAADVMRRIKAKFAKQCVECSSPCKLTIEGELSSGAGGKATGLSAKQAEDLIKEARAIDTAESIAGNYRQKFSKLHPEFPGGQQWQVHHSIPQKFRKTLRTAGIDVDQPKFLRGVRTTPGETANVHAKITAHWEGWHKDFVRAHKREPYAAEIIEKAKEVDWRFEHVYWEVEKAAGIPVPMISP